MNALSSSSFAQQAWNHSLSIYQNILACPFNQEMMQGTLSAERFTYYIRQDNLYLQEFARCHALMASRIHAEHLSVFLDFSKSCLWTEQAMLHHFFLPSESMEDPLSITPANLGYTSYLLRCCMLDPVEVGVAALLPCFWIYQQVAQHMTQSYVPDHPYARWIETYTSQTFDQSVQRMLGIFDELGQRANSELRTRMIEAFYRSACWEWHFWQDAYDLRGLGQASAISTR
jgi:thiaminase/transcriptional activator TenA